MSVESHPASSNPVRVVIVGAGVIGCATAYELARRGHHVTVIEKGPSAGCGTTSASSSIIRYNYSTRDAVLTAWEAAQRWFAWSQYLCRENGREDGRENGRGNDRENGREDPGAVETEDLASFIESPNLILRTTGYDPAVSLGFFDEFDIPYERLTAADIAERWPDIDTGSYYPPRPIDDPTFADDATSQLDGVLSLRCGFIDDPALSARNLASAARRHGATFLFQRCVSGIERDSDSVVGVTLDDGSLISATVVVNAAGPHSAGINQLAGVTDEMTIRTRALRQEVYVVTPPSGLTLENGGPFLTDLDVGQYFRPQPGGSLLVGGTEPECDTLEWVDPDHFNEYPTVEGWETAMYRLARRVPDLAMPRQPVGLASLYDVADDWVPIYDRSSLNGYFMACGTSGNQFKNAPIAGEFMAEIIEATLAGHDHDADPVQVRGAHTGALINLGAFSRQRTPAVTTGTVMG